MNALTSHAIIQSVRDTAIRFSASQGGQKEWRAILTEIIHHLPGEQINGSHFDLNQPIRGHITGPGQRGIDRFVLSDGGDVSAEGRNGLKQRDGTDEVYEWFLDQSVQFRHVIHSRQCAWFLERLRTLCCLGATESGIPSLPYLQVALYMTSEAFDQSEMTWYTLVTFLKFVLEKSDWTTPLLPPGRGAVGGPEECQEIQAIRLSSYRRRIAWSRREILEGSGVVTVSPDGQSAARVLNPGHSPGRNEVAIHELFNQEQTETLDFEGVWAASDETEPVKKKRQVREILSILEEKANGGGIREGDYKEYADLLMGFYLTL